MKNQLNLGLTLGPVYFNWAPDTWRDFYYKIADEADVDRVVVGEITCEKRAPFFEKLMPGVIDRLMKAGKEVVLASPILVMTERWRGQVRDVATLGRDLDLTVEVNDLSAIAVMEDAPFAIGPHINIYNPASARVFTDSGANHLTLPFELNLNSIGAISSAVEVPVEVFAFGRIPLAISARCYHARSHGLSKSGCQYVCDKDGDGMDVDTVDGAPFLAVNGVQTMSYTVHNVIEDLPALRAAGVSGLRLSPQNVDMVAVAALFKSVSNDETEVGAALEKLDAIMCGIPFSNGFLHGEEGFHARGDMLGAY